jgi:uncharacterized membrane protein
MMCLSTAIATVGLLINSSAIIIGAMLVAPLMKRLIAKGCALIRGDVSLYHKSIRYDMEILLCSTEPVLVSLKKDLVVYKRFLK